MSDESAAGVQLGGFCRPGRFVVVGVGADGTGTIDEFHRGRRCEIREPHVGGEDVGGRRVPATIVGGGLVSETGRNEGSRWQPPNENVSEF